MIRLAFCYSGRVVKGSWNVPDTYALGEHFETFVQTQLASGRYTDASAVLRDALRLMEERERKLGILDAAIERGIADIEAGRVHDLDDVCEDLIAEIAALPDRRSV
jgi:antitoxin ParD1/3/4